MMELITIDTNIIIKALAGVEKARDIFDGRITYISFMVDVELRSSRLTSKKDLTLLESALQQFIIHPYDYTIQERAIKIRRTYNLKIPDAFIAATALELQLPLFSGDDCFKTVKGLDFFYVKW